jgi:hypothetical protein
VRLRDLYHRRKRVLRTPQALIVARDSLSPKQTGRALDVNKQRLERLRYGAAQVFAIYGVSSSGALDLSVYCVDNQSIVSRHTVTSLKEYKFRSLRSARPGKVV